LILAEVPEDKSMAPWEWQRLATWTYSQVLVPLLHTTKQIGRNEWTLKNVASPVP